MKIEYEMTPKEHRYYFNLAMGIFSKRKSIKKNPKRKIKTYGEILFANFLVCFIYLPLVGYFDTLVRFDFFSDLLALILFFQFILVLFSFLLAFICYFKTIQNGMKGEIRFDLDGITDTSEKGKIIEKKWREIDFVYVMEKVIFIVSKKRIVFMVATDQLSKVIEYLNKIQETEKLKIIDATNINYTEENKIKKHFFNWGIYLVSFLVLMFLVIEWENYNTGLLDREMQSIYNDDYQLDNRIYSYEKFGVVEKELKSFFDTLQKNRNIYLENSATSITYLLTADYLDKNRDSLPDLLKSFPSKEAKTEKAIKNILELVKEENTIRNIESLELGEMYTDLYKEYLSSFLSDRYRKGWETELYNNSLRMKYVTRMVEILTLPDACWEIEEEKLYFCNDNQLKEYNELYDLLMDGDSLEKQESSGVKM